VRDVELRLRRGVQQNIRARVFANLLKNVLMLGPRYSRSDRIGDLYDRYLYKEAWGEERELRSFGREKQIELRELLIEPEGREGFAIGRDNPSRRNKVPALVINATSLNTGHNWRFEAVRMGEALPDDPVKGDLVRAIDKNMRLEQGYFDATAPTAPEGALQIPDSQVDFPLALAVAASAAVPGVFHPLAISDLYDGVRVQLVDGGVQDNQGLQALEDQDCERIVISDASGQMDDLDKPAPFAPKVLFRTVGVAEDRIRDEQLVHHGAREFAPVHLRMGLEAECVPPRGNERKREKGVTKDKTDFGVDYRVQDLLSRIRTDLDYFSDTEARSLEMDGYLLAEQMIDLPATGTEEADWPFFDSKDKLEAGEESFLSELDAGSKSFLRAFRLRPVLATTVTLVLLGVLGLLLFVAFWSPGWLCGLPWPLSAVILVVAAFLLLWAWSNLKPKMPWLYRR
ncbi:MAG TPA: patatin-like phospholipase family protein, partial [Solirubrobacterales bacterium]|nr:patatin-like phospholipase family protein [Solirubrobacterales bacterium]